MYQTAAQFSEIMPDARVLMSDEPEMESSLDYLQLLILVTCLEWYWRDRRDYFIGANLTIYFSRQQLKTHEFRGPDFFLVREVSSHARPSWVVWEEDGQYPDLIIELLSDSTARVDRTIKKQLYQDRFRTPEYFWFSPETLEFMGYHLVGHQYQEIPPTLQGWRWSEELNLYLGVEEGQLRYFTSAGQKLPTPQEAALTEMELAKIAQQQAQAAQQQAQAAQQQVQAAQQQARQEAERAAALSAYLRSLGVNPDDIAPV